MKYDHSEELIDPYHESRAMPRVKNLPSKPGRNKPERKISAAVVEDYAKDGIDLAEFTYKASKYESGWLIESLSSFYDLDWFQDILRLVKGGKEASVYLCSNCNDHTPPLVAAKVYRPRRFRALRKDHVYQEGRARLDSSGNTITNSGLNHAMNKRTEFGAELLHISWIEHEYKTLQILKAAGCDVPQTFAKNNNAILMSYIGDEDVNAPVLNDVDLPRAEALRLFDQVVHNIDLMLSCERIHADLSAYNILYFNREITLIDFPQAIHPRQNPNAWRIFQRDVQRIYEYFVRQGVRARPSEIARSLWMKHGNELSVKIHPAELNPDDELDRKLWESQNQ